MTQILQFDRKGELSRSFYIIDRKLQSDIGISDEIKEKTKLLSISSQTRLPTASNCEHSSPFLSFPVLSQAVEDCSEQLEQRNARQYRMYVPSFWRREGSVHQGTWRSPHESTPLSVLVGEHENEEEREDQCKVEFEEISGASDASDADDCDEMAMPGVGRPNDQMSLIGENSFGHLSDAVFERKGPAKLAI